MFSKRDSLMATECTKSSPEASEGINEDFKTGAADRSS